MRIEAKLLRKGGAILYDSQVPRKESETMHPWHDVPVGDRAPELVAALIEVPMGSNVKYELDKQSGLIRVDRTLFSSVFYPANYGFIPQTYCDDNDPLDILVLGQESLVPLCLVEGRPIGLMRMNDQGEMDDKIIAVQVSDQEYNHYTTIDDLPPHKLRMLRRFFEDYKTLEEKEVVVEGFQGVEAARDVIDTAIREYQEKRQSLLMHAGA